jgi:hypothetical protein
LNPSRNPNLRPQIIPEDKPNAPRDPLRPGNGDPCVTVSVQYFGDTRCCIQVCGGVGEESDPPSIMIRFLCPCNEETIWDTLFADPGSAGF